MGWSAYQLVQYSLALVDPNNLIMDRFPMEAVLSDTHRKAMFAVPTLGALQIILLLSQYSFHIVPVSSLVMNECLKCAMSTWGSSKKAILSAFAWLFT